MFITLVLVVSLLEGCRIALALEVKNLIGEPDYRSVRLLWEVDTNAKNASKDDFLVRFCELQSWGTQRCRTQSANETDNNHVESGEVKEFSADITGLRMATTYSFEIKTKGKEGGTREDRSDGNKNENLIVIPTKGFSAKATQCLPHASEIEVSTGPYFGGRIAVEAADGERCALDGDPKSPRDMYILRINHDECGSQVNDTTVATFVLVQENLPILTHSTRRFLVLCSYQPETLTVRAGINLPTAGHHGHGHGQASIAQEDESTRQGRRSRKMRTGKLVLKPEALVTEEESIPLHEKESHPNPIPIVLIAIFLVGSVSMFVLLAIKWHVRKLQGEGDNVSIASEDSTISQVSDTGPTSRTSTSSQIYHV